MACYAATLKTLIKKNVKAGVLYGIACLDCDKIYTDKKDNIHKIGGSNSNMMFETWRTEKRHNSGFPKMKISGRRTTTTERKISEMIHDKRFNKWSSCEL